MTQHFGMAMFYNIVQETNTPRPLAPSGCPVTHLWDGPDLAYAQILRANHSYVTLIMRFEV